jgi:hypothetical protein
MSPLRHHAPPAASRDPTGGFKTLVAAPFDPLRGGCSLPPTVGTRLRWAVFELLSRRGGGGCRFLTRPPPVGAGVTDMLLHAIIFTVFLAGVALLLLLDERLGTH